MPAFLLKFMPWRDYAYAAAALALIVFYNVHVHNLEVQYAAAKVAAVKTAVQVASDKLIASAARAQKEMAARYADNLKQVNETYAEHTKATDATHAADLQRLRQLANTNSDGSGNGSLEGASGADPSADSWRSSLIGLGYVSEELSSALHDARDDLGKCYAERDSLTGKP